MKINFINPPKSFCLLFIKFGKFNSCLIIFLFLFFSQIGCKNNKSFILTGYLTGFKDSTLLFLQRGKNIDSAYLTKGTFSFQGKIDDDAEHVLLKVFDNSSYTFLWLENTEIKFYNIKNGSIKNSKIIGSETQKEDDRYNLLMKPYNEKRDSLTTINMSGADSFKMKEVEYEFKKNDSLINDANYKFINDNPNSLISIDLLKVYCSVFGKKKTIYLFDKINEKNRNTSLGKEIQNFIALNKEIKIGDRFENFIQYDVSGNEVKLSDLTGKTILLEFWASWCMPCRRENPLLLNIYNKYKKKGFEIISISIDQDKNEWKKAIKEDKLIWINVTELGEKENTAALIYGISSLPDNFLINPTGTIIKRNITNEELSNELAKLLTK